MFAGAAFQFTGHHGHTGTIHGGIQDGDRARFVLEGRQLLLDLLRQRPHLLGDALDLTTLDLQPAVSLELRRGDLKGKARRQAAEHSQHARGVTCPQTQSLVQWSPPRFLGPRVIIVAMQGHGAKKRQELFGTASVALFAGPAVILGHRQRRVVEQLLQDGAQIAEDRLAQTDLDGFEVAHSLGLPLSFD